MLGTTGSLEKSKSWYLGWKVCHEVPIQELKKLYSSPAFLEPESQEKHALWIFFGTEGPGAHNHIDNNDFASWQAQLSGVKTWYLKPPPECYWSCNGPMETTLYPGDMIVVHAGMWYHSTMVHGPDMTIVLTTEFD